MQRRAPSIESPAAKRSRMERHGNNAYGSKGTNRCLKCQRRKGKCIFDENNPHLPCDYCAARNLPCSAKLPTPRKLQEQGFVTLAAGLQGLQTAVIGQPNSTQLAFPMSTPLRVQTNNLSVPLDEWNISSAHSDPGMTSSFSPSSPMATPFSGYRRHSAQHSPIIRDQLPPTASYYPNFRPYSDVSMSPASPPSPPSPEMRPRGPSAISIASPSDERMSCEFIQPIPPFIPKRNPGHTLNRSILPIIAAVIPKEEPTSTKLERMPTDQWEQYEWGLMQAEYLQLDDQATPALNSKTTGCKWTRKLHIPKRMKGRKLAGEWSIRDGDTEKSIKSAPSVIA